jgi:hypothetical protein
VRRKLRSKKLQVSVISILVKIKNHSPRSIKRKKGKNLVPGKLSLDTRKTPHVRRPDVIGLEKKRASNLIKITNKNHGSE